MVCWWKVLQSVVCHYRSLVRVLWSICCSCCLFDFPGFRIVYSLSIKILYSESCFYWTPFGLRDLFSVPCYSAPLIYCHLWNWIWWYARVAVDQGNIYKETIVNLEKGPWICLVYFVTVHPWYIATFERIRNSSLFTSLRQGWLILAKIYTVLVYIYWKILSALPLEPYFGDMRGWQ